MSTTSSWLDRVDFLKHIRLPYKLAAAGVLATGLIVFQSVSYVSAIGDSVAFSDKERVGNQILATLNPILIDTARGFVEGRQAAGLTAQVTAAFSGEAGVVDALSQTAEFARTAQAANPADRVESANALDLGVAAVARVGDQSNLILDPDLDSYYVMDALVLRVPSLVALTHAVWADQAFGATPAAALTNQTLLQRELDAIQASIASSTEASPRLAAQLNPPLQSYVQSAQGLLTEAAIANDIGAAAIRSLGELAQFDQVANRVLNTLLIDRIDGIQSAAGSRMMVVCALAVLLVVVLSLLTRGLLGPIGRMSQAFSALEQGDLSVQLALDRRDELGQLATGWIVRLTP